MAAKLTLARLHIIRDKGRALRKTIVSKKAVQQESTKHDSRNIAKRDKATFKDTSARRKCRQIKIWACGDYARPQARLPEDMFQQIRPPERKDSQGMNADQPDRPRPTSIEHPEKNKKHERKQRTERATRKRERSVGKKGNRRQEEWQKGKIRR